MDTRVCCSNLIPDQLLVTSRWKY